MKKRIVIASIGIVIIIALVVCLITFMGKNNKTKLKIKTDDIDWIKIQGRTLSDDLPDDKKSEVIKLLQKVNYEKVGDYNVKGEWKYAIVVHHEDGKKDWLYIIDDSSIGYNKERYSGSGIKVSDIDEIYMKITEK